MVPFSETSFSVFKQVIYNVGIRSKAATTSPGRWTGDHPALKTNSGSTWIVFPIKPDKNCLDRLPVPGVAPRSDDGGQSGDPGVWDGFHGCFFGPPAVLDIIAAVCISTGQNRASSRAPIISWFGYEQQCCVAAFSSYSYVEVAILHVIWSPCIRYLGSFSEYYIFRRFSSIYTIPPARSSCHEILPLIPLDIRAVRRYLHSISLWRRAGHVPRILK